MHGPVRTAMGGLVRVDPASGEAPFWQVRRQVSEAIADGRLPTEGVVTHTLPLKDYDDGFKMMKKGDKSLKIMLVP